MITFDQVSFTYTDAARPTLHRVSLDIPEGELCVVVGETGTGKSTLLRAINGLVPHFSGGKLAGTVTVDGRTTKDNRPRDLADVVGFVGQNPLASFVTETVEDELAYTMENLGIPSDAMRRRVEDAVDLLGLQDLRDRSLRRAVGRPATARCHWSRPDGVAAAAGARRTDVCPRSGRRRGGAERAGPSGARSRAHRGHGRAPAGARGALCRPDRPGARRWRTTRHRGARDRDAIVLGCSAAGRTGTASRMGPPPLSVRDARRRSAPLRERLAALAPPGPDTRGAATEDSVEAASLRKLAVSYGPVMALDGVDLSIRAGEVLVLMGRNGSGKSTLLNTLAGARRPTRGSVVVDGQDPQSFRAADLVGHVGLVPQDPGLLLYGESVQGECRTADQVSALAEGTTALALERVLPGVPPDRHPRDLSEGQRLALALAIVVAPAPALLLLDEPTRGLDYPSKDRLIHVLRELAGDGHAIVLATHDVELAARVADRAVVLADGQIITDGPARQVVCHSPIFAPQVAKVLAPEEWLTVDEVREALEGVVPA